MATSEILPFATGVGANVAAQDDYAADPSTSAGFSAGVAESKKLNKVWRQSSFVAAAIAEWLVNRGVDVQDDGDLPALIAKFETHVAAKQALAANDGANGIGFSQSAAFGPGTLGEKAAQKRYATDAPYAAASNAGSDASAAIEAAIADLFVNQKVELPYGAFLAETASEIDTNDLAGDGALVNSAGVVMYPQQRKNYATYSGLMTLEDEFKTHVVNGSDNLNYTAFGSSVVHKGAEFIAMRCGYTHDPDATRPSAVVIYKITPTKTPCVEKTVLYTCALGNDVRDVNITLHPGTSSYALVKFAEWTGTGTYQTRLLTVDLSTLTVVKNQVLAGLSTADFTWGNSLITPGGYLLFCTYRGDGNKISIWKSTTTFNAGTETLTMALAAQVGETANCFEPTICMWKKRYVLIYRKNGAASRVTYSYDLDNAAAWAPTYDITDSRQIYAPAVPAYTDKDALTVVGVLGSNRITVVSASTNDAKTWHTQGYLHVAGWPGVTSGSNGYPSISDLGGSYAVTTFWDAVGTAVPPTRVERQVIPKELIDVSPSSPARRYRIDAINARIPSVTDGIILGDLGYNDAKTASSGQGYQTVCEFRRALSLGVVYLLLAGSSTTAQVEIYEDGTLIATSSVTTVSSTNATPVAFSFSSPVAVSLGKEYKFKLVSSTSLVVYDYRHSNKVSSRVEFPTFVVYDSLNAAGTSIGSNSLIIPAFKYNP